MMKDKNDMSHWNGLDTVCVYFMLCYALECIKTIPVGMNGNNICMHFFTYVVCQCTDVKNKNNLWRQNFV